MAMAAAHSHTVTGDMRQAVLGQPNIQHPWSEHPTSNIQHPTSNIQHPEKHHTNGANVQHPTSKIQRRSKFQVPTATNGNWILDLLWMLDVRSSRPRFFSAPRQKT